MRPLRVILAVTAVSTAVAWAAPAPASAGIGGAVCTLTGLVSGILGKACTLATHAGKVVGAGENLLGGHVGKAIGALTGGGSPTPSTVGAAATATVGLAAIATAVAGGARFLLRQTASLIGSTTRPDLTSTWFSATYWRMAAIAALLTLPFLFAAAVHALVRADLALLARAAFGYLPLAMLGVGVAAPLTALLLSASDEMSSLVAAASGHAGADFLDWAGGAGGVVGLLGRNLFVTFFIALLTAGATIALWAELLIRDAAVYVMVLMLPLFFAGMVWPARRVWATRAIELLIALILSKFVIVAVLTLGGAALGHRAYPGPAAGLAGMTLVLLATLSPWALMRLLPLQEVAGAAAGGLRGGGLRAVPDRFRDTDTLTDNDRPPPRLGEGQPAWRDGEAEAAPVTASEATPATVSEAAPAATPTDPPTPITPARALLPGADATGAESSEPGAGRSAPGPQGDDRPPASGGPAASPRDGEPTP